MGFVTVHRFGLVLSWTQCAALQAFPFNLVWMRQMQPYLVQELKLHEVIFGQALLRVIKLRKVFNNKVCNYIHQLHFPSVLKGCLLPADFGVSL